MKTEIAIIVISLAVASAWRSGYDCPAHCPGYDPVCSTEGNTYDNKCLMLCDWAYKQCDGPCPCSGQFPVDCNCPQSKDYVCTYDNETYDNECEAKCDRKRVRCDGSCPCS